MKFIAYCFREFAPITVPKNFNNIIHSYYINLPKFLNLSGHYKTIVMDEENIPMVRYSHYKEPQYNPVTVALHALVSYISHDYRTFYNYTKWLIRNSKEEHGRRFLYYHFVYPPRALRVPWVSGMAQGLATSVMARAYFLTRQETYLRFAKEFTEGMLAPIDVGGCSLFQGGYLWIEEYPSERPLKHVLNGFVFALFGLLDLYIITGTKRYYKLFVQGAKTIRDHLGLWDLGVWSKYDIEKLATPLYHLLNTILIYALSELTDDPILRKASLRWSIVCPMIQLGTQVKNKIVSKIL